MNNVLPIPPGSAANSQTQAAASPTTRALLGFFQPSDTLGYLAGIQLIDPPDSSLEAACTAARAHAGRLAGRAEPTVTPMQPHSHLAMLQAEPTFVEHSPNPSAVRFAWVELASIVACQPKVDWDHVEQLAASVPAVNDDEGLLAFCLPAQGSSVLTKAPMSFNPMTNTFGWVVDNPDVRICGPVQGEQTGAGRNLVGFSIGPGLHQMSVVSFNGRHMLNNGYHRAVALARAGHQRVPVIFTEVPDVGLTPSARNGMFSPNVVLGPNPPRIVDFLGPAAVEVRTRKVRYLFSVHAEQHAIPA